MIRKYLATQMEDIDVYDVYFQQDGAISHTAHETINVLPDLPDIPFREISRS